MSDSESSKRGYLGRLFAALVISSMVFYGNGTVNTVVAKQKEKITAEIKVEKVKIPFKTKTRKTDNLLYGNRRVVRKGKNGLREKTYAYLYRKGKETKKVLIDKELKRKPVNEIIEIGTKKIKDVAKTSRGGSRYLKKYVMEATAYTAKPGALTASGRKAGPGNVAVDPKVIPLGKKLYVEGMDGYKDYGYSVAADTGGAIKGKKIDLYFDSAKKCTAFGRRNVKVYVLR